MALCFPSQNPVNGDGHSFDVYLNLISKDCCTKGTFGNLSSEISGERICYQITPDLFLSLYSFCSALCSIRNLSMNLIEHIFRRHSGNVFPGQTVVYFIKKKNPTKLKINSISALYYHATKQYMYMTLKAKETYTGLHHDSTANLNF